MLEIPTTTVRDARGPLLVGVDLGGTNIKIGLVDDGGATICHLSIPTEVQRGPRDATERMGRAVADVIRQAGVERSAVARVGLGTPGTMDIPAGLLLEPPNLIGWEQFPIRDALRDACGFDVAFANDAAAAAYGEFWIGSGRDFHSMALLTLGTGVGGGMIVHDQLIDGENSHGAEFGHIVIDYHDDARLCPCGQTGHLEAYASAKSLVLMAEEALASGRTGSFAARVDASEELTPLLLSEEAAAGDELAMELILDVAKYLGVGIVTLLHAIDPHGVVLGGAMTFGGERDPVGRRFIERIRQEVRRRAFPVLAERTKIEFASLGGSAGYIGAAGIARLEHLRNSSPSGADGG